MKVHNRYFGVVLAVVVLVSTTATSYLILHHFYGPTPTTGAPARKAPEEGAGEEQGPETGGLDILPMSLGIGIAMAGVSLAVWEGSRRARGDATTILLEAGLDNMTVKDVEVVRQMIQKEEFTVPELVENSPVSRSSVWRLVKKLAEKNLVEEKQKELPDKSRGKPRKIYQYVGAKE